MPPPRYEPEPAPRALARRLSALTAAGVPVRCDVWLGLHDPGPHSSRVAAVTHALARHLADGTAADLPRFTTTPSPLTRVHHLVALSPHDPRTWAIRGDALLAADRPSEAVTAYDRGIALGGLPAARAAFFRGWAQRRLGHTAEAAESFRLSRRIDPTVPVVTEALADL